MKQAVYFSQIICKNEIKAEYSKPILQHCITPQKKYIEGIENSSFLSPIEYLIVLVQNLCSIEVLYQNFYPHFRSYHSLDIS